MTTIAVSDNHLGSADGRAATRRSEVVDLSATLISVAVHAQDVVLREGLVGILRCDPSVKVNPGPSDADVHLCAVDEADEEVYETIASDVDSGSAAVVVASHLDARSICAGLRAGARGFLRRDQAQHLPVVVAVVANGGTYLPADAVPELIRGNTPLPDSAMPCPEGAISARELAVLCLASQGLDTSEMARQLAYSERTIKSIVQGIMSRFNLNNRTHAVAWALRNGLI